MKRCFLWCGVLSLLLLCGVSFAAEKNWRDDYYKPADYAWSFQRSPVGVPLYTLWKYKLDKIGSGVSADTAVDFAKMFPKKEADLLQLVVMNKQNGERYMLYSYDLKNGVRLPKLKTGAYWVEAKCWRDGKLVGAGMFLYSVLDNAGGSDESVKWVDSKTGPMFFTAPDVTSAEVFVGVYDRNGKKLYAGKGGVAELASVMKKADAVMNTPGKAYLVKGKLVAGGKVIDEREYYQAVKGSFPAKTDWSKYKNVVPREHQEFVVHENQGLKYNLDEKRAGLDALIEDSAKRKSSSVNISFKWNLVEPISGSRDWSYFDEYVKVLTERGVPFGFVYIGGTTFDQQPFDLQGDWQMTDGGKSEIWRGRMVQTPTSEKYRKAVQTMVKDLAERYHDNPLFTGYSFIGQGYDSAIFHEHFNFSSGYDINTRRAFVEFLRGKYKSIADLNKAWGSGFASFDEVTPPLPGYGKKEVNLSPAWKDYTAFRLKVYADSTVELFSPVVRSVDKKNELIHYQTFTGPIEFVFDNLKKYNAQSSDGGGEGENMRKLYSVYANAGISHRPESHYVPPQSIPDLQAMIFNIMRHGIANNSLGMVWNSDIGLHAGNYRKNHKLLAANKWWSGAVEMLSKLKGALPVDSGVGVILSWEDMFARSRCWRWYAVNGRDVRVACDSAGLGSVNWFSGMTNYKTFARQKVIIVPADAQIWTDQLSEKLASYVRGGGNLVLLETAGKYNWDNDSRYGWLKTLQAPFDSISKRASKTELEFDIDGKKIKALATLENNAGKSMAQWKLGKGRVLWLGANVLADPAEQSILKLLDWAGVTPAISSSSQEFQGFYLHKDGVKYLVVCNFMGLNEIRKTKELITRDTTIRLNGLPVGKVVLEPFFGATAKEITSTGAALSKDGFKLSLKDAAFNVYKVKTE